MTKKLRKLEVLTATDKETILVQQKKLNLLRTELEQTKLKYNTIKTCYGMNGFESIDEMRNYFQTQLETLTNAKLAIEFKASENEKKLVESTTKVAKQKQKIGRLKKELNSVRKEKIKH